MPKPKQSTFKKIKDFFKEKWKPKLSDELEFNKDLLSQQKVVYYV